MEFKMQVYEDLIAAIEEMICTSTAVMAPYPVDVVGRPAPFKKSKKKNHGEKRAPHTEIHEEYEKQNMHREHSPMHKFKYKKTGKIEKTRRDMSIQEMMSEIAEVCEAIKSLDSRVEEVNKVTSGNTKNNMAYLFNKIS
jgi:hypothetical protein